MSVERISAMIESMNTEPEVAFGARAAKYGALADPARLRIVDLLTLGDLSPTELRAELGMPSNLLSHHLRALEAAGLATSHRSEADKRRSYFRLAAGAFDGLEPGAERAARRVLFVGSRNSARSQLAAALWQRASSIPSTSAGTHPANDIAPRAVDIARRHGLDLTDREPRHLDQVVGGEDFVVTVCDTAHEKLPDLGDIHWSVTDPLWLDTEDAFENAFADISRRINVLAPLLRAA